MVIGTAVFRLVGPFNAVRAKVESFIHEQPSYQGYLDSLKPAIVDYLDRNNALTGNVELFVQASASQHVDGEDSEEGGTGLPDGPIVSQFKVELSAFIAEIVN